jgi:hypothetical protein
MASRNQARWIPPDDAQDTGKKVILSPNAPNPIGPYSQAIKSERQFISLGKPQSAHKRRAIRFDYSRLQPRDPNHGLPIDCYLCATTHATSGVGIRATGPQPTFRSAMRVLPTARIV